MANVWEVDYNSSIDSNKTRSATGIAIDWFSPIGPLSFFYAIPLREANTDVTERFRFQIGTSFNEKIYFINNNYFSPTNLFAEDKIVYLDVQFIIDNSKIGLSYKNKIKEAQIK